MGVTPHSGVGMLQDFALLRSGLPDNASRSLPLPDARRYGLLEYIKAYREWGDVW